MKNSKLTSLLSKLSPKEFKEFGKFIKSPYFNTNVNIVKFYDLIAKHFPDFANEKLTRENIYFHIYPGEKYNDSTARGLISSLLKLGEEFVVVDYIRHTKNHYTNFLLSVLSYKEIFDLFAVNLNTARKEAENISVKDDSYFFLKFRIETLLSQIDNKSYIPLTQKDIPGDMNTEDADSLINYFLIVILQKYNYLYSKTGSLNVEVDLNFLDEILSYLGKKDLKQIPILNFQYNRIMLYKSKMDVKYFNELKKVLYEDFEHLDRSDAFNLVGTLQNYCVQKHRSTNEDLTDFEYEIFKFAIEKNILVTDDSLYLSPILYSNIVSVMLHLDKIDEATEFILKYKNNIAPDRVETAFNFNMAKVFFAEKKFNESLSSLALAQNEDVFYKIFIKNLTAKIYYELGYIDELVLLLDAYKNLLTSNIIIHPSLKENHSNFISFTAKLIRLKDLKNKSELQYLKHEAENQPSLMSSDWLIKKITELI